MSTLHLRRIRPRAWRTGAERMLGQPPAWMVRLGLALGLLVLGARAGLASPTFMAPGGYVNRFLDVVGPLPTASSLANPAAARARGKQDAGYLHDYGFNLNLAPVVDVGTSNPQLYGRTFGTDPTRVGAMAAAYMEGLQ